MKIIIKSKEEIEIMRQGGKILADVLRIVSEASNIGITTKELDNLAEAEILKRGGTPSFKNYTPDGGDKKFPTALCVSVNNAVVHGIPGDYVLQEGDIAGLDLGVEFKGYYTDAATTVVVSGKENSGDRSEKEKKNKILADTAKECLNVAIKQVKPGARIGDIGAAIQRISEDAGFSVVRDLVGHGVGKFVHEPPEIPNFGERGTGLIIKKGMTFAIEPMICAGSWEVDMLDDGWTVVTRDGANSAHFEHTVAITEKGAEILTV